MINRNFVAGERVISLEELLDRGYSLRKIQQMQKTMEDLEMIYFDDFIKEMPSLNCMFKEYLEDESSGQINDVEDFIIIYRDYFAYNWGAGWIEVENGDLTVEELDDDKAKIDDFISHHSSQIAELLNLEY